MRGVGNEADYGKRWYTWGWQSIGGNAFAAGMSYYINQARNHLNRDRSIGDKVADITGFSRGGAEALEFANQISRDYPDEQLRWIGIFDAVGSIGALPGTAMNDGFHLYLPPGGWGRAYHAVAFDENRDFFPGTDIKGAVQQVFPGVHSDIGGGWADTVPLQNVALKWMIRMARISDPNMMKTTFDSATEDPYMAPHLNKPGWGFALWLPGIAQYGGRVEAGLRRPMIDGRSWLRAPMAAYAADFDFSRIYGTLQPPASELAAIVGPAKPSATPMSPENQWLCRNAWIDESAFMFAVLGIV